VKIIQKGLISHASVVEEFVPLENQKIAFSWPNN